MSSTPITTTPVHSHLLSPDEIPSGRSRKTRGANTPSSANDPSQSNYLTLKAQLERNQAGSAESRIPDRDGSVRRLAHLKGEKHARRASESSASLNDIFNKTTTTTPKSTSKAAPLIIVDSAGNADIDSTDSSIPSRALATKCHEYSDEAIQYRTLGRGF